MKLEDFIRYDKPIGRNRPSWAAYFGTLTVTGATKEEVTTKLMERLEMSTKGSYAPRTIPHGNYIAHLWREPDLGWCYAIRRADFEGTLDVNTVIIGQEQDECERVARRHLADRVYEDGGCTSEFAAECIMSAGDYKEFIHRIERAIAVQKIMDEYSLNWTQANMAYGSLRSLPEKREENIKGAV